MSARSGRSVAPWRVPRAKIAVPAVPAAFVGRPALRDALARAAEVPVTLVCAPAGYGKTLLLADWVATAGTANTAWVSLEATDNDAGRFWAAVLSAVGECPAVPADSQLRWLVPPDEPDADFLAEVVDAFDMLPEPLFLVLDDFHEILEPEPLHGVATLIRHQPGGLRLVLASRFDPPLPLARLRPQGRLAELRADALRFSPADSNRLLLAAGVELATEQLHRLVELTDGWAAGLRLAVRSLRDVADRDAFLADFASGDRSLADYLVGEVLTRLSADDRTFLQAVSICDEVTPALAEVLSGREDAGRTLDALAWESSLVLGVGTDRGWYRVHPVLRAYLRADLNRQRPDFAERLHGVAAVWFASQDQPDAAVEHARQAPKVDTLVELLRQHGIVLLLRGDHRVVRRGLATVGEPTVAGDPLLSVLSAFVHVQDGELAAAEAALAVARDAVPQPRGTAQATVASLVVATCALSAGRPVPVAPLAALRGGLPTDDPGLDAWARSVLGRALLLAGDRRGARRELEAAHQAAHEHGLDYLAMRCRIELATVLALDGEYAGMAIASAESVAMARQSGRPELSALAAGHAMLAFASLYRFDHVTAAGHATRAKRPAELARQPVLRFAVGLLDGAARFDAGDRPTGLRMMRAARQQLGDRVVPAEVVAVSALLEGQAAVFLGWESLAREVSTWARGRIGRTAELAVLATWTAVARRDADGAREALRPVLEETVPALVPLAHLEARLLETALAIGADERTRARHALAAALAIAAPADLIRPFEHADTSVRQLLVDQIGGFGASDGFALRVHRTLSVRDVVRGDGPLTGQETVVLGQLTSQRSLEEIATDLDVSVNTVKTHVRAIYAKLGVNNRRAAVITARERGLT
jgi:LuxR family maltose regulon positive regulatory protein